MTHILIAIILLGAALGAAFAHDAAGNPNWIFHGNYTSPIDGSHCCGQSDCVQLESEFIREVSSGYWINGPVTYRGSSTKGDTTQLLNEIVPHKEVQRSKDGNYWRCKKPDGSRRCFFAPPGAV